MNQINKNFDKHLWYISFIFDCSFICVVQNIIDIATIMYDIIASGFQRTMPMRKYYLYNLLGIFTFLREELIAYNLLR